MSLKGKSHITVLISWSLHSPSLIQTNHDKNTLGLVGEMETLEIQLTFTVSAVPLLISTDKEI